MKYLVYLFFSLLFFSSCNSDDVNNDKPVNENTTTLQMKNQSSKNINKILWNDMQFDNTDNELLFIGSWDNKNSQIDISSLNIELYKNETFFISYFNNTHASVFYEGTGTWTRTNDVININSIKKSSSSRQESFIGTLFLRSENLIYFDCILEYKLNNTFTQYPIKDNINRIGIIGQLVPGTSLKNTVDYGSSYIFFTYNSTAYRTKDLLVVNKDEEKVFVFTDYTVVVEVTNPNNIKTLGEL